MLYECYIVKGDGEDVKVEPDDLKISSKTLAIIINHTTKYIYLFKGSEVSIVQKFASARKASAMRLHHGYRIKHVEQDEGIDEDFIPILEHFGGLVDDAGDIPEAKSEPLKPPLKMLSKSIPKPPVKKPATATKKTTPAKKKPKSTVTVPNDIPPKLVKVVKTMMSLEPPKASSCDYLIVNNKLYIIVGDNKTDLRKGEFVLEEVTTLPEGVFPVENYYPRILVASKKVLGVELWARR